MSLYSLVDVVVHPLRPFDFCRLAFSQVDSDGSSASDLVVQLTGKTHARVIYQPAGEGQMKQTASDGKTFLEHDMVLASFGGRADCGTHSFPFAVVLPPNLPSTMKVSLICFVLLLSCKGGSPVVDTCAVCPLLRGLVGDLCVVVWERALFDLKGLRDRTGVLEHMHHCNINALHNILTVQYGPFGRILCFAAAFVNRNSMSMLSHMTTVHICAEPRIVVFSRVRMNKCCSMFGGNSKTNNVQLKLWYDMKIVS